MAKKEKLYKAFLLKKQKMFTAPVNASGHFKRTANEDCSVITYQKENGELYKVFSQRDQKLLTAPKEASGEYRRTVSTDGMTITYERENVEQKGEAKCDPLPSPISPA